MDEIQKKKEAAIKAASFTLSEGVGIVWNEKKMVYRLFFCFFYNGFRMDDII